MVSEKFNIKHPAPQDDSIKNADQVILQTQPICLCEQRKGSRKTDLSSTRSSAPLFPPIVFWDSFWYAVAASKTLGVTLFAQLQFLSFSEFILHKFWDMVGLVANRDIQKLFGNPCLETEDFSKKSVVLVKRNNGFTTTVPWTENPGKNKGRSVLVDSFSRVTQTTDFC